jgi:hypothetical protein
VNQRCVVVFNTCKVIIYGAVVGLHNVVWNNRIEKRICIGTVTGKEKVLIALYPD